MDFRELGAQVLQLFIYHRIGLSGPRRGAMPDSVGNRPPKRRERQADDGAAAEDEEHRDDAFHGSLRNGRQVAGLPPIRPILRWVPGNVSDRKSTRLNSSHGYISYAVFCLKKKK